MKPANGKRAATFWVGLLVAGTTVASFVVGRITAMEERAAAFQHTQDRIEQLEKDKAVLEKNVLVSEESIQKNINGVVLQQSQIQDTQTEQGKEMLRLTARVSSMNAQSAELARLNSRMLNLTRQMEDQNRNVEALSGEVGHLSSVVKEHSQALEGLTKKIKKKLNDNTP